MGLLQPVEARVQDRFFQWRWSLGWSPPVDSRIVLVEVDGDTFTEVGQPVSRWADDYARLGSILFEQKARVVGLDILFRPELSKLPEPDAAQIYFEVEQLAGIALTQPLVIVDSYQQKSGTSLTSIDILQASAESLGNVGVNNMLTDPDGKVKLASGRDALPNTKPPCWSSRVHGVPVGYGAGDPGVAAACPRR